MTAILCFGDSNTWGYAASTQDHVMSSALDGIHFEAADHHVIGLAVAGRLRELLGLKAPGL